MRQRTVVIVIQQLSKATSDVISGITRFAMGHAEWQLVTTDPVTDALTEDPVRQTPVDGIIGEAESVADAYVLRRKDAVVQITDTAADEPVHSVTCDHRAVAAAAAEFFLKRRFGSFAFVDTPSEARFSRLRGDAFQSCLAQHGHRCERTRANAPGFADWLRRLPRPCALLAANDHYAIHTINVCRVSGLRVPEDIAILGVDNTNIFCEHSLPPLSSILPAFESAGYQAASLLDKIMRGKVSRTRRILYGVEGIFERRSTECTGDAGSIVATAAHDYIRSHLSSQIGIKDIAAAVRANEQALRIAYRDTYGTSPLADLRELRLNSAAHMLRTTSTPVDAIPGLCGFGNALHAKTLFKRQFGMTMSQYRKSQ